MHQAKPLLADTTFRSHLETPPPGRGNPSAHGPERIVPLFMMPDGAAPGPGAENVTEHDWLAALDLVRQVSARVRQSDESSKELARNAEAYRQHAHERIEEARARAEAAEGAARAAEKRAQEAEARALQAEERVQAAERRAQTFQVQAQTAEARAKDAQAWAKRLHHTLKQEFGESSIED